MVGSVQAIMNGLRELTMVDRDTTKVSRQSPGALVRCLVLALPLSTAAVAQDRERIANEGTIGDKWMLAADAPLATAQYPAHLASRGADVCVALAYLIDDNGDTSGFSVLRQWNSESGEEEPANGFWRAFAQAGAEAVSQWKFKPRPEVSNPTPTRTVATIGFSGGRDVNAAQLRGHCRIDDLAGEIARGQAMRGERSSIGKQVEIGDVLGRIEWDGQRREADRRENATHLP
jgi:hypothetical protein